MGEQSSNEPIVYNLKTVTKLLTAQARRLILLKRKDCFPPTFGNWAGKVLCQILLLKIRHTVGESVGKLYTTSQPFISFVAQNHQITIMAVIYRCVTLYIPLVIYFILCIHRIIYVYRYFPCVCAFFSRVL